MMSFQHLNLSNVKTNINHANFVLFALARYVLKFKSLFACTGLDRTTSDDNWQDDGTINRSSRLLPELGIPMSFCNAHVKDITTKTDTKDSSESSYSTAGPSCWLDVADRVT